MALETGTFAFGAAVFPLTPSTANPLVRDADPALATALDFFAWGIENYLGARLLAQAALQGLALPGAVAIKIGIEPSPFLYSDQFKFPIFALYRKQDAWDEHTVVFDKSRSTWEFAYVLPPLTPLQQDALNPILRGVAAVLRRLAHQGVDPGYLSGAPVWGQGYGRLQNARLVSASYGGFEKLDANQQYYRAVTGRIEVLEREMPVAGAFDSLAGVDGALDVTDSDGTTVPDVVDVRTGP